MTHGSSPDSVCAWWQLYCDLPSTNHPVGTNDVTFSQIPRFCKPCFPSKCQCRSLLISPFTLPLSLELPRGCLTYFMLHSPFFPLLSPLHHHWGLRETRLAGPRVSWPPSALEPQTSAARRAHAEWGSFLQVGGAPRAGSSAWFLMQYVPRGRKKEFGERSQENDLTYKAEAYFKCQRLHISPSLCILSVIINIFHTHAVDELGRSAYVSKGKIRDKKRQKR